MNGFCIIAAEGNRRGFCGNGVSVPIGQRHGHGSIRRLSAVIGKLERDIGCPCVRFTCFFSRYAQCVPDRCRLFRDRQRDAACNAAALVPPALRLRIVDVNSKNIFFSGTHHIRKIDGKGGVGGVMTCKENPVEVYLTVLCHSVKNQFRMFALYNCRGEVLAIPCGMRDCIPPRGISRLRQFRIDHVIMRQRHALPTLVREFTMQRTSVGDAVVIRCVTVM